MAASSHLVSHRGSKKDSTQAPGFIFQDHIKDNWRQKNSVNCKIAKPTFIFPLTKETSEAKKLSRNDG